MKGRILVSIQFACLLALVVIPSAHAPSFEQLLAARLLIAVAGAVLGIAFVNLRESVTVFPEPRPDVPFVTRGIYKFVRHPMYLGVLLFGLSMVTTKATFLAAGIWLALFLDLQVKYRYEDRLLAARWPEATLYQATVGALLPRNIGH